MVDDGARGRVRLLHTGAGQTSPMPRSSQAETSATAIAEIGRRKTGVVNVTNAGDSGEARLEIGWLPTTLAEESYVRRFLLNWAEMCTAMAWTDFGINDVVMVATLPSARRRG